MVPDVGWLLMVLSVGWFRSVKVLSVKLSHWTLAAPGSKQWASQNSPTCPTPSASPVSVISLLPVPSLRGVSFVQREARAQSVDPGIELHPCLVEYIYIPLAPQILAPP